MWNNAVPWKKAEITPNFGLLDSTDDMRPGLGYDGLAHLKSFVEQGGLLITCEDTAQFAIDTGLALGVSIAPAADARVVGSILNSTFVERDNPIAYGYGAERDAEADERQRSGLQHRLHWLTKAAAAFYMDPYSGSGPPAVAA